MSMVGHLLTVRLGILKNKLKGARRHSRLKIAVVWMMVAALAAGTFYVPLRAFMFLQSMGNLGLVIIDRLLFVFFLGLFVMLIFSNCIICYSTNFKAKETEFFFTLPLRYHHIFFVKFIDSIMLSSWMFLCFLYPILSAYAVVKHLSWIFYVFLGIFFIPFAVISGAIGCLVTLLVIHFVPRKVYPYMAAFAGALFLAGCVWVFLQGRAVSHASNEVVFLLTNFIPQFGLSQFPFAPNYWISEGILKLIAGEYAECLFWWLLLTSNALFLGWVGLVCAKRIYYRSWESSSFNSRVRRSASGSGYLGKLLERIPGLKPEIRSLMSKDIKVFWRDPVQWSQFTIFFGLLAIYFANLRNLGYENVLPFWKNIISFLNLTSTNLTLASLAVRFVFPQLSLEGRCFWILGLAPIKKPEILYEKFWVNSIAALCVSLPLIVLSNVMLGVSSLLMAISIATVIVMCFTLISISIGLGALFPNFKEDNPAQIVSGFGGTLALVVSLFYIVICVAALVMPFHFYVTGQIGQIFFEKLIAGSGVFVLLLSILVIGGFLYSGNRALQRLEF